MGRARAHLQVARELENPACLSVGAEARDDHTLTLTVMEGKYHQVKRMVAAAGNRVEALHRERIGGLSLPATLAEGAWQWLDEADLGSLRSG